MEYLERLAKAIDSLEDNSDKLSKVPELLSATKGLTEEIQNEKAAITYSQKEMLGLKTRIEAQTDATEKLGESVDIIAKDVLDKQYAMEKSLQETMSNDKKEILTAVNELSRQVANCHFSMIQTRSAIKRLMIMVIISIVIGVIAVVVGLL